MAILQVLIGFAIHSMNRVVTTALGWATVLLFGKVPRERQSYLSLVVFGSVIWTIVAAGVAWPPIAAFMLAFVRIPPWVDYTWIRLALLTGVVIIPLLVGASTLLLHDPSLRPTELAARRQTVLNGYRFTLGITLTLLVTVCLVPAVWTRNLLRGWATHHFPVVIQTPDYVAVVADIERILQSEGLRVTRARTNLLLRVPTQMLTALSGGSLNRLVSSNLATLQLPDLEIVIHLFDLVVSGRAAAVTRVQMILAERLPFTRAYVTWTKTANELEDRMKAVWRSRGTAQTADPQAPAAPSLETIRHDLRTANVSFEEWVVLHRVMLLMERDLAVREVAEAHRDARANVP